MELNDRQNNMIQSLLFEGHMNVTNLSKQHSVSRKTIYDDIFLIEGWVKQTGLGLLKKTEKGNYLVVGNKDKIISELFAASDRFQYYSVRERQAMILFKMIINPMVTVEMIVEDLDVSKSTIVNDIQEIRTFLKLQDIDLVYEQRKYVMLGDEYHVRSVLINYLSAYAYKLVKVGVLFSGRLSYIEEKLKKSSLLAFDIAHLSFFIQQKRIEEGFVLKTAIGSKLYERSELNEIEQLVNDDFMDYLPLEKEYTYVLLKSFFRFSKEKPVYGNQLCVQILNRLLLAFKTILDSDYDYKSTFNLLYEHFEPSIYRLALGIILVNPIFDEIVEKYEQAYQLSKLSLAQSIQGHSKFVQHEASYLAILLLSQRYKAHKKIKKIVVACYEGTTISHSIKQQLEQIYLKPEDIICTTLDRLEEYPDHLIISTVPPTNVPEWLEYVVVNPILTSTDKIKIIKAMHLEDLIYVDSKELLKIVKAYVDDETYQKILGQLILKENKINKVENGKGEIMLKDLITADTIQFIDSCSDWKEAVQLVAKPLLKNGSITNEYVNQVIQNVETNGAYIVLKDGFALPHARASEVVRKVGMSLMVLKEKVYFSQDQQQWATVIVMLAATDSDSHLKALSELVTLISDDDKFDRIQNASSTEDVLKIIEEESV